MNNPHPHDKVTQDMSRSAHARLTYGLSPVSIANAYTDWVAQLATSPGKRQELTDKAFRQMARLSQQALDDSADESKPCIEPLPQDRRLASTQWQQWPYNLMHQSFLVTQQWRQGPIAGKRGTSTTQSRAGRLRSDPMKP